MNKIISIRYYSMKEFASILVNKTIGKCYNHFNTYACSQKPKPRGPNHRQFGKELDAKYPINCIFIYILYIYAAV